MTSPTPVRPWITRVVLGIALLAGIAIAMMHLAGLRPLRALVVTAALPFVLYVPGRLLTWGFLPGLDLIERTTASVLLSMMVSYTAMFLGEKTQPTVTGMVGVIAIAAANAGSALAAWIATRIRR